MICENCGVRPASVQVYQQQGGQRKRAYLCTQCARQLGMIGGGALGAADPFQMLNLVQQQQGGPSNFFQALSEDARQAVMRAREASAGATPTVAVGAELPPGRGVGRGSVGAVAPVAAASVVRAVLRASSRAARRRSTRSPATSPRRPITASSTRLWAAPRRYRALSASSPGAPRTTPSSSASPVSARQLSPKGWPRGYSRRTSRRPSRTSACSPSMSAAWWPAPASAATSKSG